MTDLELLEFVARGAGMPWDLWVESGDDSWNPLEDDGDAFRLGVDCGVLGSIEVARHKLLLSIASDYDQLELERRAIVLAVAEALQAKEAK